MPLNDRRIYHSLACHQLPMSISCFQVQIDTSVPVPVLYSDVIVLTSNHHGDHAHVC